MSGKDRHAHRELSQAHEELQALLEALRDLLEDLADCDADACWTAPAVPIANVPAQLRMLERRLLRIFDLEEDESYLMDLAKRRPGLRRAIERLNAEHGELLDLLAELCELAGSTLRPGSSWADIELHFRLFERRLALHRQEEMAWLEQGGMAHLEAEL